ncbi:VOC family protein [Lysinibacter sp. HNR]|uniref:VOC family protein n=1 Tax=Lysinibacter sp. HNR TaxID=3031408 RepID=UPI00243593F5|nr:VOC family protein [Lysinibacter sp. HNR]WGD37408.1 VOC family protein [Lysinibacter sp. HNR]
MTLTLGMVTIDSLHPAPLARWWAERLEGTIVEENDGWFYIINVPGWGVSLGIQKVGEVTPGKNKLHLDFISTDSAADVATFIKAGAARVAEHSVGDYSWTVLADPDGNQFCL